MGTAKKKTRDAPEALRLMRERFGMEPRPAGSGTAAHDPRRHLLKRKYAYLLSAIRGSRKHRGKDWALQHFRELRQEVRRMRDALKAGKWDEAERALADARVAFLLLERGYTLPLARSAVKQRATLAEGNKAKKENAESVTRQVAALWNHQLKIAPAELAEVIEQKVGAQAGLGRTQLQAHLARARALDLIPKRHTRKKG